MEKCAVKTCKLKSLDMFFSPGDPDLLNKWQSAVGTTDENFVVCENHFFKKDIIVDKFVDGNAIPLLNLSDEIIQLENECCGVCLEDIDDEKLAISEEFKILFKNISEFSPLTEFICTSCSFALEKYKEFKTDIQMKHAKIRNDAFVKVKEEESVDNEYAEGNMPKDTIKCQYCDFSSDDPMAHLKHIENNHSYYCRGCKFHCRTRNALEIHLRKEHNDQPQMKLTCYYCNEIFENESDLMEHMERIHPDTSKQAPKKKRRANKRVPKYDMVECIVNDDDVPEIPTKKLKKKITPQRPNPEEVVIEPEPVIAIEKLSNAIKPFAVPPRSSLNKYQEKKLAEKAQALSSILISRKNKLASTNQQQVEKIEPKMPKKSSRKTPLESRDNMIKCPECKITFINIEKFLEHREEKHPEKGAVNAQIRKQLMKIKCDHCTAMVYEAKMQEHLKLHEVRCPICSISLTSLFSLDQHLYKAHETQKEVTCDLCGEILFSKHEISNHMKVHVNQKLSRIQDCPKKLFS